MKQGASLVLILCLAGPAMAEMEGSEYLPGGALDARERQALAARIAEEQRREAEAAARREDDIRAEQARLAAVAARRPLPERLLEARCGNCHALDVLAAQRHTWLGWHFTLARMRWWNGAEMDFQDMRVLADHLAQRQPARGTRRILEHAVAVLPFFLGAGAWWWRRRRAVQECGA
jgi:hypothetical protein